MPKITEGQIAALKICVPDVHDELTRLYEMEEAAEAWEEYLNYHEDPEPITWEGLLTAIRKGEKPRDPA